MTVGRPSTTRFSPERLFHPQSVAILGTETTAGQRIAANMAAANFAGKIWHDAMLAIPDLAVIAHPAQAVEQALLELGARGVQAAIVTSQVDDLGEIARRAGVRVLGPSSFGLAVPAIGLNATLSHMPIPAGRVALATQSTSLARAVIDWAGPNGVGFSHVVGIGGNVDLGFGPTLDWLSRDPGTGLILLDIRRIRGRRAFVSAARAASRLRPVVAVRPGGRLLDPSGRADAVFAQALHRAGVFLVDGMEALFAAAETLSRAPALRHDTMAVVTNAIGPGRLACDAALRAGIELADLPAEVQASLSGTLPAELVQGLVYVGRLPVHVAEAAAMLSAVPGVGGILLLLTPTGPADAAAIEAVIAAVHVAKLPVLSCIMGEATGAAHRARLVAAGMPVFATPEQAVAAFGHLLRDREARQSARELPPARVLELAPDHAALVRVVAAARRQGRLHVDDAECRTALRAYGITVAQALSDAGTKAACVCVGVHDDVCARVHDDVCVRVHDDPMVGPAVCLQRRGGVPAFDLPPMNLPLAQDLARRAGLVSPAEIESAAAIVVRVSQLLVDAPEIATLTLDPVRLGQPGATALACGITLRPPGEAAVLAIAPYPAELAEPWHSRGQDFIIRPIRPEDAAAHAAMITRIPGEDLRYRFFTAVRTLAPEQMVRLTQIDYEREMAFIAVRERDGATVGVARLVCEQGAATAPESGEFAILVEPDAKGLGLAAELMRRLIGWARAQRISRITGQVLADNVPMIGFVRHLGFKIAALSGEPDVLEALLDVQPRDISPDNK